MEQNSGDELTVLWACPIPVPSSLHIPVCTCTLASPTMGTRLLPSVSVLLILRLQAMMTLLLFLLLSSSNDGLGYFIFPFLLHSV